MDTDKARIPWHFWLVCVLAVLWNGFGAYDHVMSLTQGDAYFRKGGMTDAQIAYMHSMPLWMYGVWMLGVWGSVLGTVFLLFRRRWAVWAFAAGLTGATISMIYSVFISGGAQIMGPVGVAFTVIIVVICAFFVWYARAMAKRGLLG